LLPADYVAHTSSSLTPRPRIAARADDGNRSCHGSRRAQTGRCCTSPRQGPRVQQPVCRHHLRPRPGHLVTTLRSHLRARGRCLRAWIANEDRTSPPTRHSKGHAESCGGFHRPRRRSTRRWPAPPRNNAGRPLGGLRSRPCSTRAGTPERRHAAHFSLRFEIAEARALTWTRLPEASSLFVHSTTQRNSCIRHARTRGGLGTDAGRSGERVLACWGCRRAVGVTDPDMVAPSMKESVRCASGERARPTPLEHRETWVTPARRAIQPTPQT